IYLKEMEKKLKSLLIEWRKTEDKNKVVRMMQALLFKQPEKKVLQRKQQKLESRYLEIGGNVKQGDKVIMKSNQQLGVVKDIRGKKAIVQVGAVPITVSLDNLAIVIEKNTPER
ncbi:MAG TPA: MutS2/Smr-associated SH3 domain-containing protein, partial [Hanamia sp.]